MFIAEQHYIKYLTFTFTFTFTWHHNVECSQSHVELFNTVVLNTNYDHLMERYSQYRGCYCHGMDAALKPEGMLVTATVTVFLTYLGSMAAACCPSQEHSHHLVL